MSRIDEALKRITGAGAGAEPPPSATGLERYTHEKGYKPESWISTFVGTDQRATEERRSPSLKVTAAPRQPGSVHPPSEPAAETGPPADTEKLVDLEPIADYLGFLARSLGRHKALAAGLFVAVLGTTITAGILMPKTYHVETKLLAQRNAVMTALSNPGRAVPWDADAPTRAAAETVLRRDNLISLIRQTDLMNEWGRTRAPILRAKDWLTSLIRRPLTEDEKLDSLIGLLEARMIVVAGPVGDGTVTIEIEWANAQMAFRLVEAAQHAFIEARLVAERAAINESIGILERYSTTLHENINATLAELQRTQVQRRPAGAAGIVASRAPVMQSVTALLPPVPDAARQAPAVGADLNDPEIPRLKENLTAKRQEIASLEAQRERQLSDLQAQLARLTTVYTPAHPSVLSVQQNIAALSHDSPQLAALKAQVEVTDSDYQKRVDAVAELHQVEQLQAEYANRTKNADAQKAAREQEAKVVPAAAPERTNAPVAGDTSDFASIRLRLELNQLESVLERTNGARIELAVSDAAFKYRYSVIRPPQVPRDPIRPNLRMIIIAGFIGSLLLAVAAAAGKDLLSDRIFDRWQIERRLSLPVLGAVETA